MDKHERAIAENSRDSLARVIARWVVAGLHVPPHELREFAALDASLRAELYTWLAAHEAPDEVPESDESVNPARHGRW